MPSAATYLNKLYDYLTYPILHVGEPKVRVIDTTKGRRSLIDRLEEARITVADEEYSDDAVMEG